jgi:hypothetical protein
MVKWIREMKAKPKKLRKFVSEKGIVEKLVEYFEGKLPKEPPPEEQYLEDVDDLVLRLKCIRAASPLDPFVVDLALFLTDPDTPVGPVEGDRDSVELWDRMSIPLAHLMLRAHRVVQQGVNTARTLKPPQ